MYIDIYGLLRRNLTLSLYTRVCTRVLYNIDHNRASINFGSGIMYINLVDIEY
jgi:hypothetical protein